MGQGEPIKDEHVLARSSSTFTYLEMPVLVLVRFGCHTQNTNLGYLTIGGLVQLPNGRRTGSLCVTAARYD